MSSVHTLEAKRGILRALWRERFHVEKGALERAPAAVRDAWEHSWQPAEVWMEALEALPAGLLRLWYDSGRGHLVFGLQPSAYRPGPQEWQGTTLESVCLLALDDVSAREPAMWVMLALVDHLLGSQAALGGPRFSDGQGCSAPLQKAAARFVPLWDLGYGAEELGATTASSYFARSLALHLSAPRRLSVLAPQVYRLYRGTLLRESWWASLSAT